MAVAQKAPVINLAKKAPNTVFENSSKILNFASKASYVYFQKTFGE